MSLVDIFGIHLEAATGTPVVLLREHDAPHRYLPIFVGPVEATAIALAVAGQEPPRPMTHDLMATLVTALEGTIGGVEITALEDGTFHARLDLHGPQGEQPLDTRPSDAIALALRLGAPIFVDESVLDAAGTRIEEPAQALTPEEIDDEIASFRTALDSLDPADFAIESPGAPAQELDEHDEFDEFDESEPREDEADEERP